ncbi:MAG: DUF2298 domain-containing protein, partial [Chloroflexota bacterium]
MQTTDILAALRWWAAISLIGLTAVPLAYYFFRRLPDKGYAFTKMLGLALTSYIFWLLSSFGIFSNTLGGIIGTLLIFAAISFFFYRRSDRGLIPHLRQNWGYVLTTELIFALLFGLWVAVRAQNPSITATEKPMEFAFLNAATFSPSYPPLDPWLSGFAISYYYKGYVMVSIVNRLALVTPAVGFNLGVAWLVAGAGVGAFGVVANLIALMNGGESRRINRLAISLGLVAAAALPLAGNNQMLLETLHGYGVGSEAVWSWVDIRDINGPPGENPRYLTADGSPSSSWWWWRSSRLIHEYHLSGREEAGLEPIAEFPGFSFVLGDMHPHVLGLPYVFLIIALGMAWYLRPATADDLYGSSENRSLFQWARSVIVNLGPEMILFSAILLGGLALTNTWDLPIHLFVILGAYVLNRWRIHGRWDGRFVNEFILLGLIFVGTIFILYYPFFIGLNSQAGAPYIYPMLMRPTRLIHFLVIFGSSLLAIVPFLLVLAASGRGSTRRSAIGPALWVGLGLPAVLIVIALLFAFAIAASSLGSGFYNGLISELGITTPPRGPNSIDLRFGASFLAGLIPIYFSARFRYIWLTLFLGGVLGLCVYIWQLGLQADGERKEKGPLFPEPVPFVLLMIFTATLLSIGPEYLYLRDNFGQRLNTIFKFYYQAWVLFGTAGLAALGYLIPRYRITGAATGALYALLFVFALQFPVAGVQSRSVENRGPVTATERVPATLDGLLFMERFNPGDRSAVDWVIANTQADAIILETTGNPYSYFSRVSANTGRPTVLGWANHQSQWRGDSTNEYNVRGGLIKEIYDTRDWNRATSLLNQFEVDYIYVGNLERQEHDPVGLQKFEENLVIAYQN